MNGINDQSPPARQAKFWLALALFALTTGLFAPALRYDFVNYDDSLYVYENVQVLKGLSGAGLAYAFTTNAGGSWMPLTWISYLVDSTLFGVKPFGYHLTSIVLHAASATLLFLALSKLTRTLWASFFVAAIFAIHPLRNESTLWISERKDVLCAFFYCCGLLAYAGWSAAPSLRRQGLVLLCLMLGLGAKPMMISFPMALLLLDFWPLGRFGVNWSEAIARAPGLIREKLVLFLACGAVTALTFLTQREVGAVDASIPITTKLLHVVHNYSFYIGKVFFPIQLTILYPVSESVAWLGCAQFLVLVGVSLIIVRTAFQFPWVFVGWFWFLGVLVPVVGFVKLGHIAVADRYSYLPSIGLTIVVVWSLRHLALKQASARLPVVALGVAAIVASATLTWRDLPRWRNSIALYDAALAVAPHFVACGNRGTAEMQAGNAKQALLDYAQALELNPKYALALLNRSVVWNELGEFKLIVKDCTRAIELEPGEAGAWNSRGNAYVQLGEPAKAMADYDEAIRLNPSNPAFFNNRAGVLFKQQRYQEAASDLATCRRLGGTPKPELVRDLTQALEGKNP